jgi:hypothetical protein
MYKVGCLTSKGMDSFIFYITLIIPHRYAKENVLKFLVGNKCDLKANRKVKEEEGKQIGKFLK